MDSFSGPPDALQSQKNVACFLQRYTHVLAALGKDGWHFAAAVPCDDYPLAPSFEYNLVCCRVMAFYASSLSSSQLYSAS